MERPEFNSTCVLFSGDQDLSEMLLPMVGEAVLQGLQDMDDDVRAVAAGALLPVANKLHLSLPNKVEGRYTTTYGSHDLLLVEYGWLH